MKIEFKSLPYYPLRITSPFGKRNISGIKGATSWHDGVDIGRDKRKYNSVPAGDILSVMDGIVVERGYKKDRGHYLKIKHQDIAGRNIETLYQHLHCESLSVGTIVKAGDVIAKMGCSGVGNGIHLHFELRINGKCIDPLPFLKNISRKENNADISSKGVQSKLYKDFKEKYKFTEETMAYLLRHPFPDEFFRKSLNKEKLQSTTILFLKKYKYGKEVLERIKKINEE